MKDIFQAALLGLPSGALIALGALGVVIVYRGTGIINFSNAVTGTVAAFVFWDLSQQHGVPTALAVVLALVVSGVIGLAIQWLVLWPMREAAELSKIIATLAVLLILESAMLLHWGPDERVVPSLFPTSAVTIAGLRIGKDRIILFGVAVGLTLALGLLYRCTRFGLATSAVSENIRAAAALGTSPRMVASVNWVIGSVVAGFVGIVLAPIIGLQVDAQTELIIPALAAALIGSMSSFGLTLVGGMVIGVSQSEVTAHVSTPGWAATVPLVVIVIALAVRKRGVQLRSKLHEVLPRVASGPVRPGSAVVVTLLVSIALATFVPLNYVSACSVIFGYAAVLISSVVVTGYNGQLSLCQFSFAGAGAVVAGLLMTRLHVPFLAALILAAVAMAIAGVLVGLPALRTRGVNLAVVTLALGVAVQSVVLSNYEYTGGQIVQIGSPHILSLDVGSLSHPRRYAIFSLVVFLLVALAIANLRRGRSGRRLLAVRSNERAARACGVNAYAAKVFSFALAAGVAAIGGVLVVFRFTLLSFNTGFDAFSSINGIVYSVLGGIGFTVGPVAGGLGQPGGVIATIFQSNSANFNLWVNLVGGLLLIQVLRSSPDGVVGVLTTQLRWAGTRITPRRVRERFQRPQASVPAGQPVPEQLVVRPRRLIVSSLHVSFGEVRAVDGADLEVGPGEVVGVIGPNGAGKTTLIDAITGFVRPKSGSIEIDGVSIQDWPIHRRSSIGLARSFQSLELFDDLTVADNIRVAEDSQAMRYYATDLVVPRRAPISPRMMHVIEKLSLSKDLDRLPSELPYGRRRLVGIARSLALEPSILCLDEPAAGLSSGESKEFGVLLRELATEWGMGILLIEHDVDLVLSVSDRVVALDFGRVIGEGSPFSIRSNTDVLAAYLGAAPATA